MKPRVELVYDEECPQVAAARCALVEAFAQQSLSAAWSEWERSDPEAPDYARLCGSPTILIDGRDVAPPPTSAGDGCCRLYAAGPDGLNGSPSADMIAAALQKRSGGGRWPGLFAAAPGALAALLPTCPFCWPLYAGTLSAVGLGFLLDQQHMLPLAGILLLLTLAPLGYKARARRGYGPLLAGIFGAGTILLGKFVWVFDVLLYAGLAALLGATVWNIWPQKTQSCPRCETA